MMPNLPPTVCIACGLAPDVLTLGRLAVRSRAHLAAENLFLRKQLALYIERTIRPRRADPATRATLVILARRLNWKPLLTVVQPDRLIRWHRAGWRLFWRLKSKPRGRPPIPAKLRAVIAELARANRTWGEERIAAELQVKLGIRVSPRTVGRYLSRATPPRKGMSTQRWATFIRNHASAVLACDFATTITVNFRVLYVFLILEVGTRRIAHWNVTAHPTAEWTLQQFRTAVPSDAAHRFLVHDRDAIFAVDVDRAVSSMGLRILKTPVRTPQANAFCERLIGTMRRECLDWMLPLHEQHLRTILTEWVRHYNRGRPHASLGPGVPEPTPGLRPVRTSTPPRLSLCRVVATPILGGLHHEYRLKRQAA